MPKKVVKKTKKTPTVAVNTFQESLSNNQGEWFKKCINLTKKAISKNNPEKYLLLQIERLEVQLLEFITLNPKEKIREML